jgi:hypothetical protein
MDSIMYTYKSSVCGGQIPVEIQRGRNTLIIFIPYLISLNIP